jgi:hypothetical protein
LAIVAGSFALRREEHTAVVQTVAWERTIDVEGVGPVEHSDWEENVPSGARDLSCDLEYRTTQPDPAPRSTETCGTPYTIDDGTGYGEVVQDCEYRVYDEMCTYTVDEWTVIETLRRSGNDLNPIWPDVRLASDQRQGEESESYRVTLASQEDVYSYAPATATEFAAFLVGTEWTITVNGLGSVVGVEAAP